jgi:energy-coupling factor transport system ATP-binding protein
VFQYPEHQLFGQTVLADACFGPKNLGMSKEEAEASAKKMLELVGIGEEYYYVSPLEMSGGQKRRVAIAGVLAMNPRILILDEPAAGLDPETKHMVFDLLTKIKRELGLAIVLVSHHMEDVAEYADKVLVLNKGRLEMTGTPEEVFRQADRLTEIGIGIPQITAFTKILMDRDFPLPHAAVTVEQAEQMILNLAKVGGTADVS